MALSCDCSDSPRDLANGCVWETGVKEKTEGLRACTLNARTLAPARLLQPHTMMRSAVLLVALLGAASGFLPAPRPLARSNALHATTATETVKRAEFVDTIAEKSGLSKKDADAALTATLSTITESLAGGKKVTSPHHHARCGSLTPSAHARASSRRQVSFIGFGSFEPRARAARTGRNPKTGEALQIAASTAVGFSASKVLKEAVNNKGMTP